MTDRGIAGRGMIETLRHTQKKYGSRAMVTAIGGALFFILIGMKAVGKGMLLGTLFSVFNFVLMGETLPLRMGRSKGQTFVFNLLAILFRYGLMAAPVILAVKFEQFSLPAVIFGLFMIQLVILAERLAQTVSASPENQ